MKSEAALKLLFNLLMQLQQHSQHGAMTESESTPHLNKRCLGGSVKTVLLSRVAGKTSAGLEEREMGQP